MKQFLADVAGKPPVVMPFAAVVHVLWLSWTVWTCMAGPMGLAWLQVAWMLSYTVCWVAACDARKWGIFGYVLLTLVNTALHAGVKSIYQREMYTSSLFLVDVLFSFYLVLFFRRITGGAAKA